MSVQLATILQKGRPFLVGEWLVEPILNRVTRRDVSVQLEPKSIDVLLYLAEHAGEVVPKHALLDEVWATEFAADNTIATRIADLRRVFGDDAQNPRYIETIRKRGYRLIAEVRLITSSPEPATPIPEALPTLDQETNPYPGLAAFTEADADRFFGREAEAAALWRKISARRLLAVIGPSGVGKSSLLRAGVAARTPPGWRVVVFTPGENPALSLARALAPDYAGDPTAMARLLGFSDTDTTLAVVSRWRGQFDEAVLVVDQFEELFTLNPPETQASFIVLLRRLVDATDVHVVLAMRDDYLYRCQQYPQISPIFDAITPLAPPTPEGLRRALKEPAARRLYRFDSELLVDRMIAEVEGERGALPLMAFAVHRLWEERDRENRLLTEDAYKRIGGVGGALAKHADGTLERIGPERLPIVRELFRNLVTAEGTRAVREVDELLSVYPEDQRETGEQMLRELIDARLLTGYREQDDEDRPMRRVEIIHESLLTSWPRLVRWQTQDADSVRLRDELRQAARTWDEHDRGRDYLWTGKAYREFTVWRDNYPGGLTALEEHFVSAMTSHALRSRRRRRVAVSAVIALLLLVLGVVAVSRQQAVAEARRAEAAKLLALGQLRLEDYPTATLAHAVASLELADSPEARRLALQALWQGPTAFVVNEDDSIVVEFSETGEWLIQGIQTMTTGHFRIVTRNGSSRLLERVHDTPVARFNLNPGGTVMYTARHVMPGSRWNAVLWSLPEGRRINEAWFDQRSSPRFLARGGWNHSRILMPLEEGDRRTMYALNFDGSTAPLGVLDLEIGPWDMDHHTGRWFASVVDGRVAVIEIGDRDVSAPRYIGRHGGEDHRVAVDPDGRWLATSNSLGEIIIWDPITGAKVVTINGPAGIAYLAVSAEASSVHAYTVDSGEFSVWTWSVEHGTSRLLRRVECGPQPTFAAPGRGWDVSQRIFARDGPGKTTRLWSLRAPADAEPLELRTGDVLASARHSFHPSGDWIATAKFPGLVLWPLSRPYPWVIQAHSSQVQDIDFAPSGEWLASGSLDGVVRVVPLEGEVPEEGRVVFESTGEVFSVVSSPDGTKLLVGGQPIGAMIVPLDGSHASPLGHLAGVYGGAFSPDGQVALTLGSETGDSWGIYLWDTETLEQTAAIEPFESPRWLGWGDKRGFLPDGRILSASAEGVWISDPTAGTSNRVFDKPAQRFAVSEDGSQIFVGEMSGWQTGGSTRLISLDLETGRQTHLASHGDQVWAVAVDAASNMVVSGDRDGVVRVGSTDGSEPHLLFGHKGWVRDVEIDPLGRWIATGGQDGTVRIWPMPDLTKPPLHTLPHDELLAKLKSLTNLRVVRDDDSPTGWTLTHDPFPGWETVPTW